MPADVAARIAQLGGPAEAIFSIWPDLRRCAHVQRPSSSDGVGLVGGPVGHAAGLHVLVLAADVSRSAEALQVRAWATGLGWCNLSKSGAVLERSVSDTAVDSPERLVFEAAPTLGPGGDPSCERPEVILAHMRQSPVIGDKLRETAEAAARAVADWQEARVAAAVG